jgi:hypothetical protein
LPSYLLTCWLDPKVCYKVCYKVARWCLTLALNPLPNQVVRWCLDRGVAIVPGVATPTEMERAMGLGLTHLKFFPAETLGGTSALKAFAAPYSALRPHCASCRWAILAMAILAMAILAMAILAMAILAMAILAMAILAMVRRTMALLPTRRAALHADGRRDAGEHGLVPRAAVRALPSALCVGGELTNLPTP